MSSEWNCDTNGQSCADDTEQKEEKKKNEYKNSSISILLLDVALHSVGDDRESLTISGPIRAVRAVVISVCQHYVCRVSRGILRGIEGERTKRRE